MQTVELSPTKQDDRGSEILARYREARANDQKQQAGRVCLGTKITFNTLQYAMTTTFVKETDARGHTVYRLNGDKKFIGNAARVVDAAGNVVHRGADFLLVFAVDDPAKAPKDRVFHCFLVPRERIGEENIRHTGGEWNKTGLREVNNGNFDLHGRRFRGLTAI